MLNAEQAKAKVETQYPGAVAKACVDYNGLYIVRVEHPDPDEQNYDPFFSVDPSTGETRDYSVLTDGNIEELAALLLAQ